MTTLLPTIAEITNAINAADVDPASISDQQVIWLGRALQSSYLSNSDHSFAKLADEYCDATDGDDLQQDVTVAFSKLPNGSADWIISDLAQYFDSDPQFYELAHAMLALAFPVCKKCDPSFLNGDIQRIVLLSIVHNESLWSADMTFHDRLARHGLPTTRNDVENILLSTGDAG